jgi:hypothetical protein
MITSANAANLIHTKEGRRIENLRESGVMGFDEDIRTVYPRRLTE